MQSRPIAFPKILLLAGLTVFVFLVLLASFSPSWVSFRSWIRVPEAFSNLIEVRRGVNVALQVVNPSTEIVDPIHTIVRWRLLIPEIGHILHLPPLVALALSPFSCLITLGFLIAVARSIGRLSWRESALVACVAGAGSWFYTSMGWLGYYDAILALALLVVAFAQSRWLIAIACLAAPWVDERFVMGLPLALLSRLIISGGTSALTWSWVRKNALLPLVLVGLYVPIRLWLAGQGGTNTVSGHFAICALSKLSPQRVLFGIWEGLRVGWVPLLAGLWVQFRSRDWICATLLALGVFATAAAGLATANDLSRSMMILIPAVPLGWILFRRSFPSEKLTASWLLAGLAVVLPAHHVVSDFIIPVESLWTELRRLDNPPQQFSPNTYLQMASGNTHSGDSQKLDQLLSVALRLSPGNAETLNQAAVILASAGRMQEARSKLDEAIQIAPSDSNLWLNRARVRSALGDSQGAENDGQTATKLSKSADDKK